MTELSDLRRILLPAGRCRRWDITRAPRTTVVGRVILLPAALVALPGFVTAVSDIADRGP